MVIESSDWILDSKILVKWKLAQRYWWLKNDSTLR